MLNVGSLFSGIGGFDLGLERAGMRIAWQCEADEFCRRVLARHWPGVPCYPDVRELAGATVTPVDVLCGGFPCQDISTAGRGAGIDGARSGLWGEYARLVGELRPRYVIVENVAALLARGLGRVLGDLAAFGYDAEWDCLPASAFGAPHRRDRLWLVAYPADDLRRPLARGLVGSEGKSGREASPTRVRQGYGSTGNDGPPTRREPLANAERLGRTGRQSLRRQSDPDWTETEWPEGAGLARGRGPARTTALRELGEAWSVEPAMGRVADGFPGRMDELAALGNALVPQIAEWLGTQILEWEGGVT